MDAPQILVRDVNVHILTFITHLAPHILTLSIATVLGLPFLKVCNEAWSVDVEFAGPNIG